jgi:hypothetical protein
MFHDSSEHLPHLATLAKKTYIAWLLNPFVERNSNFDVTQAMARALLNTQLQLSFPLVRVWGAWPDTRTTHEVHHRGPRCCQ